MDCFTRVANEQGIKAFWRGNLTNVIRYFPTQAFNFAFKDTIKALFPKYSPKTDFLKFFLVNMASGGLAGAGSLCIVYPLDYARTRLASDVGSGKAQFSGLMDCLTKTAKGPGGFMSLYNGFGVSVMGIIPYRGVYFGMYDSLAGINPFRKDKGAIGLISKFAIAQATAITAGYASYPFDTVRRRLQMQSEKPESEWLYKGTVDCFFKIMKDEGWSSTAESFFHRVCRGFVELILHHSSSFFFTSSYSYFTSLSFFLHQVPVLCSRVLVPMPFVPSAQPLCWCFTARSRPPWASKVMTTYKDP